MDQISQKFHSSNHKTHSYDQMRKMIVNLGIKKGNKNDNSSIKINNLQNTLIMSIFDTPEKYLSHGEGNSPSLLKLMDCVKIVH